MEKKAKELKLTKKQIIFCHEYVVDWNASRACRVAGYSKNSCYEQGSQNLTKLNIQEYIEFIQKDLAKLAGISALKNIQELSKIAYSSIAHLHNTWVELKVFEKLTDDQKASIESIDTKTETRSDDGVLIDTNYVKIKLFSKTQAIETINKMLGWNAPEKRENLNIELISPEDKLKRLQKLKDQIKNAD